MTKKEKNELIQAIADYIHSEGCGCCEDEIPHDNARDKLGQILDVPMYKDKSGYDFSQFISKKS